MEEQSEKLLSEFNFEAMLGDKCLSTMERLQRCVYFVEANNNEYMQLWQQHAQKGVDWFNISVGTMIFIGTIGKPKRKRDVCVAVWFAKIYGQYVGFYEPTSRFVDWSMIEAWFVENCHVKEEQILNLNNFGIVLNGCKELAQNQTKTNQ